MSSWLRLRRRRWRSGKRPHRCRSSLSVLWTQSGSGSSRAWDTRGAASQGWPPPLLISRASAWSSGKSSPASGESPCCWHPANPSNPIQLKGAQAAARTLGMRLEPVSIQGPNDFDSAGEAVPGTDGLLCLESPLFTTHRAGLAELAAKNRLPAIYGQSEYVEVGGLMSYGTHFKDLYRRAAWYVDKILKGAKPGDLPVEQPTKFELVINLKTAKALGLTIP